MKRAEVQLPDPLYQKVEGIAQHLHLSVPEVLCRAAEELVKNQPLPGGATSADWRFPEALSLGQLSGPVEDWRQLANEPGV
jgi:hypothetical protein